VNFLRTYDVATDGRQFWMIKTADLAGEGLPIEIIVVQNLHEELKRLVPVG